MGLETIALIALSAESGRQQQRSKSKAKGVQQRAQQELDAQQAEVDRLTRGQEIESADPLRAFKRRVARRNLRIEAGPPEVGVAGVGGAAGAGLRI